MASLHDLVSLPAMVVALGTLAQVAVQSTEPPSSAVGWLSGALNKDSIVAAALLAIAAAYIKFRSDLSLTRRKDRLSRVNAQLKNLYGPLYAAAATSDAAWTTFRKKFWPDRPTYFDDEHSGPQDIELWRWWISEVVMPINESIVNILAQRSDLIRDECYAQSFQDFIDHVAGYRAIMPLWKNIDTRAVQASELRRYFLSVNTFPKNFLSDVRKAFLETKREQQMLIGSLQDRRYDVRADPLVPNVPAPAQARSGSDKVE